MNHSLFIVLLVSMLASQAIAQWGYPCYTCGYGYPYYGYGSYMGYGGGFNPLRGALGGALLGGLMGALVGK
ncbi:hypothetical protein Y032_0753g2069 [Ancylostoma ceylanicum]|uniref:Glycine zipper 2TM domain-containing protein n=1 Tax=Ancylostoma ceylanicum TaxID=53326 RepID=A0A016WG25_9BILA|nr:hypothetical protein Y032_0753g2069 [Ancylostoma ceylanicum]